MNRVPGFFKENRVSAIFLKVLIEISRGNSFRKRPQTQYNPVQPLTNAWRAGFENPGAKADRQTAMLAGCRAKEFRQGLSGDKIS